MLSNNARPEVYSRIDDARLPPLDSAAWCARRPTMSQNPPFPSPEELKAKLSEFMKTNFGDKVSFATYTEPDLADAGAEEKPERTDDEQFVFDFLPRDIKAHLDRFVIKQDEAKKVLSIAVCDHYNHVNYLRRLDQRGRGAGGRNGIRQAKRDSGRARPASGKPISSSTSPS